MKKPASPYERAIDVRCDYWYNRITYNEAVEYLADEFEMEDADIDSFLLARRSK